MSTAYWIENEALVPYLNFVDDGTGEDVNIATSETIRIEYVGRPAELSALSSSIDKDIANYVYWKVLYKLALMPGENNTVLAHMCIDAIKSADKLLGKLKALTASDMTIKQWDYAGGGNDNDY